MRILQGHTNSIQALAYSPDGLSLASAGDDRIVRVWDPVTGQNRSRLHGARNALLSVVYGPDGRSIFAAGFDRIVYQWDDAQEKGKPIDLADANIWSLATTRSLSRRLLAVGSDRRGARSSLCVRDLELGRIWERNWFPGEWSSIWSVAFDRDGELLAAGRPDGTVMVWRLPAAEVCANWKNPYAVNALTFSPDGRSLAALTGPEVWLWDVAGGTVRGVLGGERDRVWSASFSPDGRTLATGHWDSTVRLWDVSSRVERRRFNWQLGRIRAVAVAPDGMTAAAAGDGRDIVIWDLDE